MRLSVIVPTFNRCEILRGTLPALLAQDFAQEECEIIVVLDACTDDTLKLLRDCDRRFPVRAFESPRRGPSAARNVGIEAARGELVLFLDDDLVCPADLFRKHSEAHCDGEPSVVHGPIYVSPASAPTIVRHIAERFYERYYRSLDPRTTMRFPDDIGSSVLVLSSLTNSSVRRDVLLRANGFDEEICAAEDLELGLRLWKMGLVFRYLPAATVSENYVKSSWEFLDRQAKALGAGELRICRKHPEYRAYSSIASHLSTIGVGKRYLKNILALFPISPVALLALPLRLEKLYYSLPVLRRAAVPLLRLSERIVRIRSASRAAGSWRALQNEFGRKLPVLMYHKVCPSNAGPAHALTVPVEKFESQIRWLSRNGYSGIRPSDWLRWRREGGRLPNKPVLITFDDGYHETAEYALPILRRYGFTAVVFIVTGRLGGTNTWDEAQGCSTARLMTGEQIRHWAGQGIEFGAHSRTHADLTTLSSVDCAAQVRGSNDDLAAVLGKPICSFAYPYGAYNDSVRDCVRKTFDLAFTTEEGVNVLPGDPLALRRAYVGAKDSLFAFGMIVRLGGLQRLRDLRARFGVRSRLKRAVKFMLGVRSLADAKG